MPAPDAKGQTFERLLETLRAAGFQVSATGGGRTRIEHGGCAAVLEQAPDGAARLVEPPGYLLGQHIARLEDRGFQKYLVTPERRVPALAEHLRAVHDFSERLKTALGIRSLYNESLGTVSNRYLYDRVEGREGPRKPHF